MITAQGRHTTAWPPRGRKRTPRRALALAAGAAVVALLGTGMAHAATVPAHRTAYHWECWPYAVRGHGLTHTDMCVPASPSLAWWRWENTAGQAWEDAMHYTECWQPGRYRIGDGLIFGCERLPGVPAGFPPGTWTVIGQAYSGTRGS